mgnify:FL=1
MSVVNHENTGLCANQKRPRDALNHQLRQGFACRPDALRKNRAKQVPWAEPPYIGMVTGPWGNPVRGGVDSLVRRTASSFQSTMSLAAESGRGIAAGQWAANLLAIRCSSSSAKSPLGPSH